MCCPTELILVVIDTIISFNYSFFKLQLTPVFATAFTATFDYFCEPANSEHMCLREIEAICARLAFKRHRSRYPRDKTNPAGFILEKQ